MGVRRSTERRVSAAHVDVLYKRLLSMSLRSLSALTWLESIMVVLANVGKSLFPYASSMIFILRRAMFCRRRRQQR